MSPFCWLCGDAISARTPGVFFSEVLPFCREPINYFVTRFELKPVDAVKDNAVVCDNCYGILGKVDQVTLELDAYVGQLKKRVATGLLEDDIFCGNDTSTVVIK